jgi:hypothetical protein
LQILGRLQDADPVSGQDLKFRQGGAAPVRDRTRRDGAIRADSSHTSESRWTISHHVCCLYGLGDPDHPRLMHLLAMCALLLPLSREARAWAFPRDGVVLGRCLPNTISDQDHPQA